MKFINENEYFIDDTIKELVGKAIVESRLNVSDKTEYYFINEIFLHKHYEYMKSCTAVVVHNTSIFIGIYFMTNGIRVNDNGPAYISFEKRINEKEECEYVYLNKNYWYDGKRVINMTREQIENKFVILNEEKLKNQFYMLTLLNENGIENRICWIE